MILRRFLLATLGTIVVTIAVSWFWLLHTESGMRWLWGQAQQAVQGELNAQSVSGSLSAGVLLHAVNLRMDGVTVSADKVDVAIDFDILPLSLDFKTLRVTELQIGLLPGNSSESQLSDPRQVLESLVLPIRVLLTDARINGMTISGLIENRTIHLREVALRAQWKDRLRIEHLRVSMAEGSTDITASMELWRPFSLSVSGQLKLLPLMTEYDQTINAKLSVGGSLDSMTVDIETIGLDAKLHGSIGQLLTIPNWDVALDVSSYERLLEDNRVLNVQNIAVTSVGHVNEYSLQGSTSLNLTGFEPIDVRLSGTGSNDSFNLSSLMLDSQDIALSATANARWSQPASLVANIDLNRLQPHAFVTGWPPTESVSGSVSLLLENERLILADAKLGTTARDVMLNVTANIDLASTIVEGDLKWKNIQWPITASKPQFASERGAALLSGTIDDWKINAEAAVRAADIAGGDFVVVGGGDREKMALKIEKGNVLGGSVLGELEYSWIDDRPLVARLDLVDVSIGSVFPEWPGQLSGGVAFDGHLQPLRLEFMLNGVEGSLRGESLTANGGVTFGDSEFLADAVIVEHGESRIFLGGSLFSQAGLAFEVQLFNLENYQDDYHGSFDASGHLSLAGNAPALELKASSDVLGYRDYRIDGVTIRQQDNEEYLITANGLSTPYGDISDIAIRTMLSPQAQAMALSASIEGTRIDANVAGAFGDWRQAGRSPWKGQIRSLQLNTEGQGSVELLEPTGLALSSTGANIEPFCIGHEHTPYICAEGSWSANGAARARMDLSDIPIGIVNTFAHTNFDFSQLISGSFAWRQEVDQSVSSNAELILSPGIFRDISDSRVSLNTGPGKFKYDVRDGRLLTGMFDLPMPGTGVINGNFLVLDISQGTKSSVAGNLDININNISMLAAFTPLVDEASGDFDAHMLLQGFVAEPSLSGDFSIADGKLAYLPLGLKIDELQLSGQFHDDRSVELDGNFLAGDGQATVRMRADYESAADSELKFELLGENLAVISVPDIQATADIDLRARYDGGSLTLGGKIFIPRARITPQNMTAGRVSESNDVVIVAGTLPDEENIAGPNGQLTMHGELELGLGEDIVIDLDIAKANLSGSTVFTWSGDPIPLANGRYDLQGDIQAFGQVLEISEGAIRFPNIPADNPFIRVRAERDIFGNSQIKRAGVLVDGTARRQTIEAYTDPPSNEERALTLLVTGSDFDLEQGIGAIDFGTYIAPKLFVSYAIGLFESENVISARYDLARGFGVKATSGQRSSGVDFTYRIER